MLCNNVLLINVLLIVCWNVTVNSMSDDGLFRKLLENGGVTVELTEC